MVGDGRGRDTSEGAELFIARAREVDPRFDLSDADRTSLETLIQRLDGLPLAIELAASRIKLLPVTSILERLDNRLLARPRGEGPTRQQTMNDAISWSYDLLDHSQQWMFAVIAVFAGGAGLDEVEAVMSSDYEDGLGVLEDLSALVDHSLVSRSEGSARYRMLEVVRDFARSRLAESGREKEIHSRHHAVYRQLAARARPHLADQ